MTYRMYLPYQSARMYQDRGMMKWMGFFLSEHTASLEKEKRRKVYTEVLTVEEKYERLTQLYVQQLEGKIEYKKKEQLQIIVGKIYALTEDSVIVENPQQMLELEIQDILDIQLEEIESVEEITSN